MARILSSPKISKPEIMIPSFGFVGEMASGKNTYADELKAQLESEFGVLVHRPSFSAKIIDLAVELFGMEGKDRLLIGEFAAKMREIDPQVWVKYVIRDILENDRLPFAADGLRFSTDAELFRKSFDNLVVIRIEADFSQRMGAYKMTYGRYPTQAELNNKGEGDMQNIQCDLSLFNNYEVADMKAQISRIVEKIREGTLFELLRQ